jgi:hypothetical protein
VPANFSQITVELTDLDGYNSLVNASEGFSSGAPLPGIIGYVYSVNSSGLPLINNIPNTPSDDWHTSVISRHLMYSTGGAGSQGTQIHSGETVPPSALGLDRDYYLNTETSDLSRKYIS